eukprot:g35601.t1
MTYFHSGLMDSEMVDESKAGYTDSDICGTDGVEGFVGWEQPSCARSNSRHLLDEGMGNRDYQQHVPCDKPHMLNYPRNPLDLRTPQVLQQQYLRTENLADLKIKQNNLGMIAK